MGPLWWDGYAAAQQDALTLIVAILKVTGPVAVPDKYLVAADTDDFIMRTDEEKQFTHISIKEYEGERR